jgi:hypothetical protein
MGFKSSKSRRTNRQKEKIEAKVEEKDETTKIVKEIEKEGFRIPTTLLWLLEHGIWPIHVEDSSLI